MRTTVVTFRAPEAEDRIAAFAAHVGTTRGIVDRGVLGGVRRYEVDSTAWAAYTREATARPEVRGLLRLLRCGGCAVEAVAPGLASHQRSTGHAGRTEVRP